MIGMPSMSTWLAPCEPVVKRTHTPYACWLFCTRICKCTLDNSSEIEWFHHDQYGPLEWTNHSVWTNWEILILRNRKYVPCFYQVIETWVKVWENEKCFGNTSHRQMFAQLFGVLLNFHKCFYNLIETRRTCFLFLLENTVTQKRTST